MSSKRPHITLCCFECQKSFGRKDNLKRHLREHGFEISASRIGRPRVFTPNYSNVDTVYYGCPCCSSYFEKLDQVAEHVEVHLIRRDIYRPTAHDRYTVEGFDISEGFYQFQLLAQEMANTPKSIHMESHVQHVLSLSSIFLAIPGHFHKDIKKFIPNDKLIKLVNDLENRFSIGQLRVKNDVICRLMDTVNVRAKRMLFRKMLTEKICFFSRTSVPTR